MSEIEESLKNLLLFAKNFRCQGILIQSMTWIMLSRPAYLVQQMLITYIKIIILKS
jgi:hypothetical protein